MTFVQWFLFAIVPLSIAVAAIIIGESFRAHHTNGTGLASLRRLIGL
jgi:hypothetical protein